MSPFHGLVYGGNVYVRLAKITATS